MKNPTVFLLIIFVLFSCKSSTPKGVLPAKKMQAVLWDLMQADGMADYYSTKDSTFKLLSKHADYYEKVFAIHKISKKDFQKSLSYYQNHPGKLKPIFDSLQHFGQKLQNADTLQKKPVTPVNTDSLKRKPHVMARPK